MSIQTKTKVCLTAAILGGVAALGWQLLEPHGADTRQEMTTAVEDDGLDATTDSAALPGAVPARAQRSQARDAGAEAARQALAASVQTWFDNARSYQEDDRAAVMEAGLEKLVQKGPASVFEIERQLDETTVYERQKRAAAFHALGRIGTALERSNDPQAKAALDAIQRLAKAELELPALIEPDPMADVYAMSEQEQHELLHQGILIEQDGELLQPSTPNKLPVIRMLRAIGGDQSVAQLKTLASQQDNPPGVSFALEQAIAGL